MLRISSDGPGWSMKWLSIFGSRTLKRFSRRKHSQADSTRATKAVVSRPLAGWGYASRLRFAQPQG